MSDEYNYLEMKQKEKCKDLLVSRNWCYVEYPYEYEPHVLYAGFSVLKKYTTYKNNILFNLYIRYDKSLGEEHVNEDFLFVDSVAKFVLMTFRFSSPKF